MAYALSTEEPQQATEIDLVPCPSKLLSKGSFLIVRTPDRRQALKGADDGEVIVAKKEPLMLELDPLDDNMFTLSHNSKMLCALGESRLFMMGASRHIKGHRFHVHRFKSEMGSQALYALESVNNGFVAISKAPKASDSEEDKGQDQSNEYSLFLTKKFSAKNCLFDVDFSQPR